MTPAEIRTMDEANLDQQLTDLHKEWRDLRFAEAVGKLSETHRIREIRKDIARIHTIRTERQIAASVAAGEPLAHRRKDRKRR
ncbi:MAG: hypothetical protein AVDCRST_MAG49-3246 [uncultured Thermomicrobiales bacterium]|uniref:Large ribosomal subunit protein uL29 n=1 Tax=uncultured Thermomicrobiales bacterium TaxID=1645740 RepID=A0A6J4V750_9BACT|nr:MAG: hypothetical protein AVDCRST_MAG49-3246 [uncultured Thermomicrobiales bacterium]